MLEGRKWQSEECYVVSAQPIATRYGLWVRSKTSVRIQQCQGDDSLLINPWPWMGCLLLRTIVILSFLTINCQHSLIYHHKKKKKCCYFWNGCSNPADSLRMFQPFQDAHLHPGSHSLLPRLWSAVCDPWVKTAFYCEYPKWLWHRII